MKLKISGENLAEFEKEIENNGLLTLWNKFQNQLSNGVSYDKLREWKEIFKPLGLTFDFGLDADPYDFEIQNMEDIKQNNALLRKFVGDENLPYYLFKSELQFHTNWNLLMIVIEQIDQTRTLSSVEESYLYCVELNGNYASVSDGKIGGAGTIIEIKNEEEYTWIDTAYKLAIEFVKWYNSNKK